MPEAGQFNALVGLVSRDSLGLFTNLETGNFAAFLKFLNDDGYVVGLFPPRHSADGISTITAAIDILSVSFIPGP